MFLQFAVALLKECVLPAEFLQFELVLGAFLLLFEFGQRVGLLLTLHQLQSRHGLLQLLL